MADDLTDILLFPLPQLMRSMEPDKDDSLEPGPAPPGVPDPQTDDLQIRERLRRGRQSLRIDTRPVGTGLQIGGS